MSNELRARAEMEMILLVEDDPSLRLAVTKALRSVGYQVLAASNGPEGLSQATNTAPALVLLDVMLPGMNGFEICEELRKRDPLLPIIMVTAKGDEQDRVRGLRLGADDYIVKPFGVAELLARVDAALRRVRLQRSEEAQPLTVGLLEVDFRARTAKRRGEAVEMTSLEFKLLQFLLRHEGSALPRQRILDMVWGADYFGTDRTVDNFINRLRSKLEEDPKNPVHLVTVRGSGYRFHRSPPKR